MTASKRSTRTVNAGGNQTPAAAGKTPVGSAHTRITNTQLETRIVSLEAQYGLQNQICIDVSRVRLPGAQNGAVIGWQGRMWLFDGHVELSPLVHATSFDVCVNHVLENSMVTLPQYSRIRLDKDNRAQMTG